MKFVDESVVTSVESVPGAAVVTGGAVVSGTKGQAATETTELLT